MSVLLQAHQQLMAQGHGWMKAASILARRLDLDLDTVVRTLRTATRDAERYPHEREAA